MDVVGSVPADVGIVVAPHSRDYRDRRHGVYGLRTPQLSRPPDGNGDLGARLRAVPVSDADDGGGDGDGCHGVCPCM